ncbi:MAG TPA: hypothetical protein G4O11_05615 [Anaerolineae bacterium]|nr:hypothetical protein [Anaerolineae bacterium]
MFVVRGPKVPVVHPASVARSFIKIDLTGPFVPVRLAGAIFRAMGADGCPHRP